MTTKTRNNNKTHMEASLDVLGNEMRLRLIHAIMAMDTQELVKMMKIKELVLGDKK